MGKYVIKRLLQLIPVVLGITFLSFAMMRLAGGDAVTYMYENAGTAVSQEVINEARAEYGLDQPFLVQYGKWLKGMLTGNLGESYVSHQDVAASFAAKLPATLLLAAVSLFFTILIALPLGILSAVKKNRWIDFVIRFFSFIGNSMPGFFAALVLMYFFSIRHHIYLVTLEETAELSAREYTLEKLEEQFSRSGFLRIHKSYLLNYRYVYHIGNDTVELTPHRLKKLPLSHRRSAAVRKRYQYFMRGEDDT